MAEAILTRRGGGASFELYETLPYTKIFDFTVTGSATSSLTFDGFELEEDEEYLLVSTLINSTSSNAEIRGFVNGNTTNTNYYHQFLTTSGTSISVNRVNSNILFQAIANRNEFAISNIKLTNNGFFVWITQTTREYGTSNNRSTLFKGSSTFTMTSITQLTLTSSVTNGIGVGSRFQLRKISGKDLTWATT